MKRQNQLKTIMMQGLLLALLWSLASCASNEPGPLSNANVAYQRGQYASAIAQAKPVADRGMSDPKRRLSGQAAEAAYIVGISAYRLKDIPTAQKYLHAAVTSSDSKLVGVELGLLYSELARHDLAAKYFLIAAENTTGFDRAQSSFYAGIAQQKIGQWNSANLSFNRALSYDNLNATFRQRITDQMRYNAFAVQLGAFEHIEYARTEAVRYTPNAQTLRLNPPRVMSATYQGKLMYLVWVGQFNDYASAAAVRTRIGAERGIVVFVAVK